MHHCDVTNQSMSVMKEIHC